MIVKDEAQIIERALASVRNHISHWLIVDTGSSDDTKDIVQRVLADVPGRLYERPFVDFGYNRTEAVQAARVAADYTLVLDADEVLIATEDFAWPELQTDVVEVAHMTGNHTRRHPALLSNRRSWEYDGVLFERLRTTEANSHAFMPTMVLRELKDGFRHTSVTSIERNTLDARVLEAALREDEENLYLRYRLAVCYRDSNRGTKALEAFTQRAALGGDRGEVADSLLQVAHLMQRSGADPDLVIAAYLNAWDMMPTRAEPLTDLAGFAREQGKYSLAQLMAQRALSITPPLDVPYIDETVYLWRSQDEYAVACYWNGYVAESAIASGDLIARGVVPDAELPRVEQNLRFARARCEEAGLTLDPSVVAAGAVAPAASGGTDEDVPVTNVAAENVRFEVGTPATVAASPSTNRAPATAAESDAERRIPVPMTALDDKAHQFRGLVPAMEPENN
jgi:hypothetical protein